MVLVISGVADIVTLSGPAGITNSLFVLCTSVGPSVSWIVGMLVRAREGRGGGGSHSEELHCSPGKVQQATDTVLSLWCTAVGTVVSLQSTVQCTECVSTQSAHQSTSPGQLYVDTNINTYISPASQMFYGRDNVLPVCWQLC